MQYNHTRGTRSKQVRQCRYGDSFRQHDADIQYFAAHPERLWRVRRIVRNEVQPARDWTHLLILRPCLPMCDEHWHALPLRLAPPTAEVDDAAADQIARAYLASEVGVPLCWVLRFGEAAGWEEVVG